MVWCTCELSCVLYMLCACICAAYRSSPFCYPDRSYTAASHLLQGLEDLNSRFALALPQDPAAWAISHINVELEALAGAQAGYSMRQLRLETVSPTSVHAAMHGA